MIERSISCTHARLNVPRLDVAAERARVPGPVRARRAPEVRELERRGRPARVHEQDVFGLHVGVRDRDAGAAEKRERVEQLAPCFKQLSQAHTRIRTYARTI